MNRSSILQIVGLATLLVQPIGAVAELTPTVGVVEMYNDNIYDRDNDDVDSWITKVSPGVRLDIDQGASSYVLEASAETGMYSTSSRDDYTDYRLLAAGEIGFDLRNRMKFDVSRHFGHDLRGTGRTDVAIKSFGDNDAFVVAQDIAEPDVRLRDGAGLQYLYGAKGARGRLVLSTAFADVDYQNHEQFTGQMDYSTRDVGAVGYLGLLPRTSFLVEARAREIDYAQESISPPPLLGTSRDSMEYKYFVGAEWEATAKTDGSVRFGYQERHPDEAPPYDNFYSSAWEANVTWKPKSYSALRFHASRGLSESASGLTFVDDQVSGIKWRHSWSALVSTEFFVQYEELAYQNATRREDDIKSFGMLADYKITDAVILNTTYVYSERDTSAPGLNYYKNTIQVGAQAKFQ